MRDLADWTDPAFRLEDLPRSVPVAYVETCDACGGSFDVAHCWDLRCPWWRWDLIGCHRAHDLLDAGDAFAAMALPIKLGLRWYGGRN